VRNSHISGDYLHIPFFHDGATTTTAAAAAALKKIHFHLTAEQKAKCAPSSFTNYVLGWQASASRQIQRKGWLFCFILV
jgi:hypothetical protein